MLKNPALDKKYWIKFRIETEWKRRWTELGVSAKGERYLCEICGNEVVVEKVGGGTLVCCGEEMTLIEE